MALGPRPGGLGAGGAPRSDVRGGAAVRAGTVVAGKGQTLKPPAHTVPATPNSFFHTPVHNSPRQNPKE